MAKKGGSKEGFVRDSSMSMPSEQKTISESSKQKVAKIHDMFPLSTKDHLSKILLYYDDDENKAIDALTRDGGKEALSSWVDSGSLKSKNNKNKKKKKKGKKDLVSGSNAAASFDADDSSSIHSSGNVDTEVERDYSRTENSNGNFQDAEDEKNSDSPILHHERLKNLEDEPLFDSSTKWASVDRNTNSREQTPEGTSSIDQVSNKIPLKDSENTRNSPVSDSSEKLDEQKREKYRSIKDEGHTKYQPRQRTSSFRRSKTSSISEESSQHNSQAIAAPTKRGYEKCKKDLNRQTISLQRIHLQLEKGLEESGKKLKNSFNDIRKLLDKRQELVEKELEKTKEEALNLLKSRQDLAVELKRRVDRTPSLTEAEWSELRSDIKQFVTERKYDDELGKTIWYQWSVDSITDIVNSFGEVQPVKNVYSQRSHSALDHASASHVTAEPSPSSSVANEDTNSTADKNDVGNISDTVEDEAPTIKKETVPVSKNQSTSRSRIFSNKSYNFGRFPNQNRDRDGGYQGHRGNQGNGYPRQNYNRNFNYNRNYNSYNNSNDYRHQDRDGRNNESSNYSNHRNMNRDHRNERNQGRAQNTNYRARGGYRVHPGQHRHNPDSVPKVDVPSNETTTTPAEADRPNALNGFVNN